eukprot:Em0021g603a
MLSITDQQPYEEESVTEPLHHLTKEEVPWNWGIEEPAAFQKLFFDDTILVHFDPSLPIGISCDASEVGLGAILFHRYSDGSERPIANASKTLTSTQRGYSQIQKEALAIIFALNMFHQFLYSCTFILVTDHKPLIALFGPTKATPALAGNRLAWWALMLSQFNNSIDYRKMSDHGNASSWLPPVYGSRVMIHPRLRPQKVVWIHLELPQLQMDEVHQLQMDAVHQLQMDEVHQFQMSRRGSSVSDGRGWNDIPPSLACAEHQNKPSKVANHPWILPEKLWSRVHVDHAINFPGSNWLVLIDAYSKYPYIHPTTSTSTKSTTEQDFARVGYPHTIVSDNVTSSFSSEEFQAWCRERGIIHLTGAPYHLATNGAGPDF